jgi:hypothetical protein
MTAIGIEFAHITYIGSGYYNLQSYGLQVGLDYVLLNITINPLNNTLQIWVWLISTYYLTRFIYGSYIGKTPPKKLYKQLFTFGLTILFFILYAPWQSGRQLLFTPVPVDDLAESVFMISLSAFIVRLGIFALLTTILFTISFMIILIIKLRRKFYLNCCPECNFPISKSIVLNEKCDHCGFQLDQWRYIAVKDSIRTN